LRPFALASVFLSLTAAALVLASPATAGAQTPTPHPCQVFAPCTPVVGPWVTSPSDSPLLYNVVCPDGQAVGADVVFPGAIYPVGLGTGPGYESTFGVFPAPARVTYQPAVGCLPSGACLTYGPAAGCSPPGATLASRRQAAGLWRPYRTRVRTVRIRPGAEVRVRLGCARGRRLLHSGSAVAFFTRRPPSPRVVEALEHRHRRTGRITRTHMTAPPGVGDDERVELQVSAICRRARDRAARASQVLYSTPRPCEAVFTPCTPGIGPWVTTPDNGDDIYVLGCPSGQRAVGSDAVFPYAVQLVVIQVGAGIGPGIAREFSFGVVPREGDLTYKPGVGCSPPGALLASRRQVARPRGPYRRRVRTVGVRPGAEVRLRLRCARGQRLLHSGSAVAFFTRRPPRVRVVEALEHRHRRSRSVARTVVAAPPGVGDDERVELQLSVICTRALGGAWTGMADAARAEHR
jgi:hypothetical protein